ncbi:nuclear receptor ROR-gamma-like [Bombina bombina]|uniref:nuclear receptor ROR-gamma-like n=1 Tax=Bombina bombina TaxID=8345 RepID=UPI00235A6D96|nr:nuclear receptor ROR-gamma-like [Bombina bombina]
MSREAVKFGRMSKTQHAILQAEVQKYLLRKQRTEPSSATCCSDPPLPHALLASSPDLSKTLPQTSSPWSGRSRWDSSCSVQPCPLSRPEKDQPIFQPHASEKSQTDLILTSYFRDQPLHMETARPSVFHRLLPNQSLESYCTFNHANCQIPESMMSLAELELLTQNVLFAHRTTCQFRQEELHILRWEMFSSIEVHSIQQKPMDQMWELCVCQLTDAIQYIVEFAKRLSGFMELNPNDQIVLLKAGVMELLLIRMSQAFNCHNSTVFFERKYANLDMFQTLGCNDLISSMFDLCHYLGSLNLSDQEIAFFSATLLLDPNRPWLQDKPKVEILHRKLELSFRYLLQKTNRESLLSKLPLKEKLQNICQLHMEKLNTFQQMYPGIVRERFPALYRELFVSEPENA